MRAANTSLTAPASPCNRQWTRAYNRLPCNGSPVSPIHTPTVCWSLHSGHQHQGNTLGAGGHQQSAAGVSPSRRRIRASSPSQTGRQSSSKPSHVVNYRQQQDSDGSIASTAATIPWSVRVENMPSSKGCWSVLRSMSSDDEHIPPTATIEQHAASDSKTIQGSGAVPSSFNPVQERTRIMEIKVQDFALVQQQTVSFEPGLNAVTGESGSGKSVLVEALNQLLGGPAPAECVRDPADSAVVEGTFWLGTTTAAAVRGALLQEGVPRKALPDEAPGKLTIKREILRQPGGGNSRGAPLRSRCFINGSPVTLRTLRSLSNLLVDMNGQHGSLALREGSTQLALLDRVAGCGVLVAQLDNLIARMAVLENQLEALDMLGDPAEREARRKMVEAVRRARIQAGEEVKLRQEVRDLDSKRSVAEGCTAVKGALSGDGSTSPGIQSIIKSLESQIRGMIANQNRRAVASSPKPAALPSGSPAKVAPGAARRQRATTVPLPANQRTGKVSQTVDSVIVDPLLQHLNGTSDGVQAASSPAVVLDEMKEQDLHLIEEAEEEEEEDDLEALHEALEALANARTQLTTAENCVKTFGRQSALDLEEYEEKSERLNTIEKLLRSQRCRTTEELLASAEEAEKQLEQYEDMAVHEAAWEDELNRLRDELLGVAIQLSEARRAAAPQLARHVEKCLSDLAMGGARMDVAVTWRHEPQPGRLRDSEALDVPAVMAERVGELGDRAYRVRHGAGLDTVELRLAAGPAEPLRPLSAVASGGENARVMLALKAAPSVAHSGTSAAPSNKPDVAALESLISGNGAAAFTSAAPVMILDELDSGIGSRLGTSVGAMLLRMAGGAQMTAPGSQIICVTHLPQVACYAQHHVKVVKVQETCGRVTTRFQHLSSWSDRASEVADMMSMEKSVAEDMLRTAQQARHEEIGSKSG